MPYQNYNIQLGGFNLTTTKCILQNVKNSGFPAVVYSRSKRGGYSGTKLVTPQFASYQFVFDFQMYGDDFADMQAQYDAFTYILGLVHSLGAQTMKINRPDGLILQIDIKAVEVVGDMTADNGLSRIIEVTLNAEYPFLQNASPTSQDVLLNNGGGIAVPMSVPLPMSGGTTADIMVSCGGNYAAYPIFTFVGPLTHPQIKNETTNQTLSLDYDLAADNDSIVIDTYLRTVIILPSGNIGRQYASGDFWTMPIGDSTLKLITGDSDDTGKCTVFFRDHYLGI